MPPSAEAGRPRPGDTGGTSCRPSSRPPRPGLSEHGLAPPGKVPRQVIWRGTFRRNSPSGNGMRRQKKWHASNVHARLLPDCCNTFRPAASAACPGLASLPTESCPQVRELPGGAAKCQWGGQVAETVASPDVQELLEMRDR